jgi:aspartate aminotransferase-like enzyme
MSKEILNIAGKQPCSFRTNSFTELVCKAEDDILDLINCKGGHVAFLSCSGSGAMDAAVSSLIKDDDKVLVINGGTFGTRWLEICHFYNLAVLNFPVEFAKDIDIHKLEKTIIEYRPNVILMQATESTILQRFDVKTVGLLSKKYGSKLIVDAITAFAIDHYDMDQFHVDVTILSSQKGFGLSAGLSMVVLKKQEQIIANPRSYYFNLSMYISKRITELNLPFTPRYTETGMPFTPSLIALEQLSYQLREMVAIGIDEVVYRVHQKASHFRELVIRYELPLILIPETPSNCGSLYATNKNSIEDFTKKMEQKNLFFSSGPIDGKRIGIAHLGDLTESDNEFFINELSKWINDESQ